jgi:hypothetical protein
VTSVRADALSPAQLHAIVAVAYQHGVHPYSGERLNKFVNRLLRELDTWPAPLAYDITAILNRRWRPNAVQCGKAALWSARLGLTAFGFYSLF